MSTTRESESLLRRRHDLDEPTREEEGEIVISFEIKGLPKTTNSGGRTHWSIKAREAKYWINIVVFATVTQRPKTPFQKAKLTLTRCSSVESDFDGLVSSFKHVIDGLIAARIIVGDKMSNIGQPVYRWEKAKPKVGRIKITIEETT